MKRQQEKGLVILDIDETLLHSVSLNSFNKRLFEREPGQYNLNSTSGLRFLMILHYVSYLRPYLKPFLNYLFENWEVALWTSGGSAYAQAVAEAMLTLVEAPDVQFSFVFSDGNCTRRYVESFGGMYATGGWVNTKNLKKLKRKGYDLRRVLMIDNSPEKLQKNYGNLVQVSDFTGNPEDSELLDLPFFLEKIKGQPDFRIIEKRRWREQSS